MVLSSFEWLEADGLGGFASGTNSGVRSRRYHGLLLVATTPPTGRVMLVNGLEAWVETPSGRYSLTTQHYAPDVRHPDGVRRIESFSNDPWPRWIFRFEDGTRIEHDLFVRQGTPVTALSWRLLDPSGSEPLDVARGRGRDAVRLFVRPLMSGRDYHSTHHENPTFRFGAQILRDHVTWRVYDGLPDITAITNGNYSPAPEWYRNFMYEEERIRGLDYIEDLASPGVFTWDLASPAVMMLTTTPSQIDSEWPELAWESLRDRELQRRVFASVLHRAADAYLVKRDSGKTIVAGYPWFTDWGRDTFIALRGLAVSTGRLEDARDILLAWAGVVSEGMLPNRFPDQGDVPEFNSVDASLWYVIAVHDFLAAAAARGFVVSEAQQRALRDAVSAIVDGFASGTRYGIRCDADGLLACGVPGVQLTWMDSKIGDWVVTPRIGKPVEIQALWLNALAIVGQWTDRWNALLASGTTAFRSRFWNEADRCLFDVVDVDHQTGTADPTFRPNQILAVGGLPQMLLERVMARQVVDAVEARLVTPLGLRSLAPGSPDYAPRYEGGPGVRDARYHQGTVWPWLMGPFVEAWVRVRGSTANARREARQRFLEPLLDLARNTGGHLPEIADAEPPHTPRGCPCQAWSVAEILRLEESVLAPKVSSRKVTRRSRKRAPAGVG